MKRSIDYKQALGPTERPALRQQWAAMILDRDGRIVASRAIDVPPGNARPLEAAKKRARLGLEVPDLGSVEVGPVVAGVFYPLLARRMKEGKLSPRWVKTWISGYGDKKFDMFSYFELVNRF